MIQVGYLLLTVSSNHLLTWAEHQILIHTDLTISLTRLVTNCLPLLTPIPQPQGIVLLYHYWTPPARHHFLILLDIISPPCLTALTQLYWKPPHPYWAQLSRPFRHIFLIYVRHHLFSLAGHLFTPSGHNPSPGLDTTSSPQMDTTS